MYALILLKVDSPTDGISVMEPNEFDSFILSTVKVLSVHNDKEEAIFSLDSTYSKYSDDIVNNSDDIDQYGENSPIAISDNIYKTRENDKWAACRSITVIDPSEELDYHELTFAVVELDSDITKPALLNKEEINENN